MTDKQGQNSQRRRTPPNENPIVPQELPELQPLNQSLRQTQQQMTQMQDYITQMQARNYQLSPEIQMEQRQQQLIQMQNYISQMQAHNYQPFLELSPEAEQQDEAHDVQVDYQVDLRPKKLTQNVLRELMFLYDPLMQQKININELRSQFSQILDKIGLNHGRNN